MLAFCDRYTCSVSLYPPQAAEGCGAWPCHYPFGPPQPLRRGRCFASARKFAPPQGPRDDASIVPYETQGKALPGFAGYLPPQGGNAPLSLRLAAHYRFAVPASYGAC